jgi:O-antigen/teichoic acid export membrane protein
LSAIKKNYIFNLLVTGFNILFPVISFPYAAKILGPVGIGKVQFILSFTQYFALVAALGIPIYGVRLISQSTHNTKLLYKNLSELVFIHTICSVIITIVYIITISSFSFFSNDKSLYFLSALIILMGFTTIDWYFTGIENFKLIAIRSVSIKIVSLFSLYLFVKNKSDYDTYLLISLFSILGNNIINLLSIRKHLTFSHRGTGKHLKPLMYTFGTTMATSMYTMLDTILIGFFADEQSVGLYSASIKLTKIFIPFIISSATVLMPRISKLFQSADFGALKIILGKSFNFITIMAVPICIALLFLAPELIYVFSGEQFSAAVLTMQILSPLALIIGLGYFWGFQILIPAEKEREMLISVILGMVVNLSLNCFLIPLYKQNGAAIANVISELVVTLSYMFFCFKIIPFKIAHGPLFFNLLATIPFIFIVMVCKFFKINVYYILITGSVSFIVSYFFIQIKLLKNSVINELMTDYLMKGV